MGLYERVRLKSTDIAVRIILEGCHFRSLYLLSHQRDERVRT
jgi:hypothetical protein